MDVGFVIEAVLFYALASRVDFGSLLPCLDAPQWRDPDI